MSTTFIAIGASIAAFWGQAKNFFQKAISIVIRSESLNYFTSREFLKELHTNSKKIGIGNSIYLTCQDTDSSGAIVEFLSSSKSSYLVFYKGFHPILISSKNLFSINLTYIVGTFPIAKILSKIGEKLSSRPVLLNRFYVSRISGTDDKKETANPTSGSFGNQITGSGFEGDGFFNYYEAKEWVTGLGIDFVKFDFDRTEPKKNFFWHETGLKIKEDVAFWLRNQKWYSERGIAWRRGCLLHGEAGSGKSKLIMEICSELNIPLRVFDISSMTNSEFVDFFENSPKGSVILIEDIDSTFSGRENLLQKNRINEELLTFDCLINTLSGAKQTNGVYVFITTNNIDKLDSALIRSGRIDGKFEIPHLCENGRRFIAANILNGFEYLIEEIVMNNLDLTAADFENVCIEKAKQELWKNKK